MTPIRQRHAWTNRLQTAMLILALIGIGAIAGGLLFGSDGLWVALGAVLITLVIEHSAAWRLTLRLYRARALVLSPQLALLAQFGLSRVREFDADLAAAELTGDPEGLASALVRIERASGSWRAAPAGLGQPEPSWLRTHPATEQRVRRLLELAADDTAAPPGRGDGVMPRGAVPVARPPRWHVDGLWR